MAEISKQALLVANNTDFPNNNAGAITPAILRSFNTDMIDSTVNQTQYNTNSGSWNVSIGALNTFTSSQQPQFTNLNAFTASQLTINSGYNASTSSFNTSISGLQSQTAQLSTFTGSINEIRFQNGSPQYSTRLNFGGFISASFVANVGGLIADINVLQDGTKLNTSSFNSYTQSQAVDFTTYSASAAATFNTKTAFNAYTASINAYTASIDITISNLVAFSSSLDATYATDAQLGAATASLINSIATKLNTSSFNDYTQSINTTINSINSNTGSYATTGSNSFTGSQTITGSVYGNVVALDVSAYTASMDLSKGNFFTLQLSGSQNVRLEASNIKPGQTINLRLNQATASVGTISFPTYFDFPAANIASASAITGAVDILSFLTFDTNTIYSTIIKNLF
jgi:hypothetical protein